MSKALIDLKETMRRTGLCKSAVYNRMADGTFPKACKIGVSTRWVDVEVDAWVEAQISARDHDGGGLSEARRLHCTAMRPRLARRVTPILTQPRSR